MNYSNLSTTLTNTLENDIKKKNGIYFTPPSCIHRNIEILKPYMDTITNVLEPSCGSCEYIVSLHKHFNHLNITGIEFNPTIYTSITKFNSNNTTILQSDFMVYETTDRYGLIIGNPPYYVMEKKDVNKDYTKFFDGRPNIFILFIIKSLRLLKDNGILSFILPKSFLNCSYYDKTRKYILKHFQILHIEDCIDDKYLNTSQPTIMFILQKKNSINNSIDNNKFNINIHTYSILNDEKNITILKKYKTDSKTLCELGFKVNVGKVVWNQAAARLGKKDKDLLEMDPTDPTLEDKDRKLIVKAKKKSKKKSILTDDETKTRLIYSTDIVNNTLGKKTYTSEDKKNYINKPGKKEIMLVMNRGYGVSTYKFNYCLINLDHEYLIENHLICIRDDKSRSKDELLNLYKKIIKSLEDSRTKDFINIYCSNNALNTTELNNIVPIFGM